jgi:hypothetical protein
MKAQLTTLDISREMYEEDQAGGGYTDEDIRAAP